MSGSTYSCPVDLARYPGDPIPHQQRKSAISSPSYIHPVGLYNKLSCTRPSGLGQDAVPASCRDRHGECIPRSSARHAEKKRRTTRGPDPPQDDSRAQVPLSRSGAPPTLTLIKVRG